MKSVSISAVFNVEQVVLFLLWYQNNHGSSRGVSFCELGSTRIGTNMFTGPVGYQRKVCKDISTTIGRVEYATLLKILTGSFRIFEDRQRSAKIFKDLQAIL